MKKLTLIGLYITIVMLTICSTTIADDYIIGSGDILEIRFWQDANLNTNVRVNLDGMIAIDIVGRLKAAGKTTSVLQDEIVRLLSRLDAPISQAVVRVLEYNFQHVFVKGQILTPGKHTFEFIPNLWTIINEAGGVTNLGDLTRVTIIRGGEKAGEVVVVDVLGAIERGEINKLPKIGRQDTIEIPTTPYGFPAADIGQQLDKKNFIYVIGAVNVPGPIQFEQNVDVLDALALAGGPTPDADMKKARIISKDGYFAQTMEINLERYSTSGRPVRYILKKEDTFLLPRKGGGLGIGTVTAALGIITSSILIANQIR
jgi:protein involved in polysaccharide export with SLBB domain